MNTNYYAILDQDDFGIIDSGATDSYIKPTAPTKTKTTTHNRIQVTIPNGSSMESTAKATLQINDLPEQATSGFIIPGLNKTLISVTKLCNAGCKVLFSAKECIVT